MRAPMHSHVSFVAEDSLSIAYSAEAPSRDGRVACHVLRYHGAHDARVRYTIAIRNESATDVHAHASTPDAFELRYRTIVQATIAAYSDFSTTIELEIARYGGVPTVHVELSGDDVDFALIIPNSRTPFAGQTPASAAREAASPGANLLSVATAGREAVLRAQTSAISAVETGTYVSHRSSAPPVRQERSATFVKSPSALPAIAFFALAVTVAAIWFLRPNVATLVVPDTARAGKTIAISYRATGFGNVEYRIVGPDAASVASGSLAIGSGTFFTTLPKDTTAAAYLVRVGVTGVFGSQFAEAYTKLPKAAPTAPSAPRIARAITPPEINSLALDRSIFTGGDTIDVFYTVSAASGSVALVDPASQISYGTSRLSATGRSTLTLPRVDAERFFAIVVTARRGPRTITSRVAITVQPAPLPSATPALQDEQTSVGTPTLIAPDSVAAGRPISVMVRGQATDIVVALVDSNGIEVGRRVLPTSLRSVTFTAPIVRVSTRYEFRATYAQGAGSETLVRAITIAPRSL